MQVNSRIPCSTLQVNSRIPCSTLQVNTRIPGITLQVNLRICMYNILRDVLASRNRTSQILGFPFYIGRLSDQWRNFACWRPPPPPRSRAKSAPPPLIFFVSLKKKKKKRSGSFFFAPLQPFCAPLKQKGYPKYFFRVDWTLNWTGKYTNKAFFQWKGLKFRKIAPPLYGAPPPPAQRGLRGPKLRHCKCIGCSDIYRSYQAEAYCTYRIHIGRLSHLSCYISLTRVNIIAGATLRIEFSNFPIRDWGRFL